jgi:hypothetical protein
MAIREDLTADLKMVMDTLLKELVVAQSQPFTYERAQAVISISAAIVRTVEAELDARRDMLP